jgi:acyl-CoA synthetase (NDP forming)
VIVIVPMTHVEPLVKRAAALGVGGMILYSAGFAEVGTPEQILAQHRIADSCRNLRHAHPRPQLRRHRQPDPPWSD